MIDARLRRATSPVFDVAGRRLADLGVSAAWVTAVGWGAGVAACVGAGLRTWPVALIGWLVNRTLDGIDGAVARAGRPTARGGFLDIVADFSIYGGFVLGMAVAVPPARLACVALLVAYCISATTFLALSSLLERTGEGDPGDRSLRFAGGLAEGAETIAVYIGFCLFPRHAAPIAWAFSAAVAVTAVQRVWIGARLLGPARHGGRAGQTGVGAAAVAPGGVEGS